VIVPIPRAIGNFDEEKEVGRWRVCRLVLVWGRPEDRDVRFRFAVGQRNRVAGAEDDGRPQPIGKESCKPTDTTRVSGTDWHLRNNLPADEFNSVILSKDAGFDHPVILSNRETE